MGIRLSREEARSLGIDLGPGRGTRSKYRNVPTEYNGRRFSSLAEALRAQALDLLITAGEIDCWIPQVPFTLGVPENRYVADFLVIPTQGRPWVEDVKGTQTAKFRRDKKLWAAYGPIPLRILAHHGNLRFTVTETVTPERRAA